MPVLKRSVTSPTVLRPGLERRLVHLEKLMVAALDFSDGPWAEPETPHSHVHEQITYIASGKVRLFCEGDEPVDLETGDLFFVPSGRSHGIQLLSETARLVDAFSPLREEFLR